MRFKLNREWKIPCRCLSCNTYLINHHCYCSFSVAVTQEVTFKRAIIPTTYSDYSHVVDSQIRLQPA